MVTNYLMQKMYVKFVYVTCLIFITLQIEPMQCQESSFYIKCLIKRSYQSVTDEIVENLSLKTIHFLIIL